jgi:hypothetical protein
MKRCGKISFCLAGALALTAISRAEDIALTGNPYTSIVARNIFGLLPPPVVDPNPPPVEPAVKITPNGIMSVFGQWQVLFKTSGGDKPGEQSYMLGEGQRQDDIEVVKIDQKSGVVTFNNHGVVEQLALADASANSTANTATKSAQGVWQTNPQTGLPVPTMNGVNAFPNPFGNRGANNAGSSGFGGAQNGAANSANGMNLNFGAAQTGGYTAPQPQNTMDPDVQKVIIVANHLKALQDGDPVAKIYPPTDLDDQAGIPSNVADPSPPDNPSSP